jgi:hypothetical protein
VLRISSQEEHVTVSQLPAGGGDFDFLFGSWQIVNDRLKSRLTNSDEWERFAAVGSCRPILGGIGNIDDFRPSGQGLDGFEGASLRLFNPATGLWSIYWADNVRCALYLPVVGCFVDGVGEFFGDDQHEGKPVLARFRWSGITPHAARWEQAFSEDRGATWETNWIMTFTRSQAE